MAKMKQSERKRTMREAWRKGLILGSVILAVAGGWLASRAIGHGGHGVALPAVRAATLVAPAKALPSFRLDGPGGAFANEGLRGHWTLLFFGYTHCPDVCPTALSLLRDVRGRLAGSGAPLPAVVFISVDPARDKPDLLGRYVPAFDPSFIGVTGSDEALAPLVKALGVFYQRNEKEDPRNYTVDHSAGLYLIDPTGRLQAVFMPPVTAERMAEDYRAIVGATPLTR